MLTTSTFTRCFWRAKKPAGKWQAHARTSRQIPLFQKVLTDLATEAGLGDFTFWGDFARTRFAIDTAHDLVFTARNTGVGRAASHAS